MELLKKIGEKNQQEVLLSKGPFFASVLVVYATTLLKEYELFDFGTIFGFSAVILFFSLNYIFYEKLFSKKYWIYFIVQGMLLFNISVILGHDFEIVFLGLIPVLYLQSVLIFGKDIRTAGTLLYLYIMFFVSVFRVDEYDRFIDDSIMIAIICVGFTLYAFLYLKEIELRVRAQNAMLELEDAYRQIEELTILNERRRFARDLHDTLSQGLVGVIMQLDAIHANLDKDQTDRAKEIAMNAMVESKGILSETRLMINDLRVNMDDDKSLEVRLNEEIESFERKVDFTIQYTYASYKDLVVDTRFQNNVVFVIRELLNNISKHAKASKAIVSIEVSAKKLSILVKDNGVGFNTLDISNLRGHFGILGIKERVKLIDGNVEIKSSRISGTTVRVEVPLKKCSDEAEECNHGD